MDLVHKNYAKAAKLTLIAYAVEGILLIKNFISIFTIDSELAKLSIGISPELMAMSSEQFKSGIMISIIMTSLYYLGIAYLIRKGYDWVKYILLILTLLGTYNLFSTDFSNFASNIVEIIVAIVVTTIKVWITVLLFKAYKASLEIGDEQQISA
jgi:hypothetical protein